MMRKVRAEARDLKLPWEIARPILEEITKRLLPDTRPLAVRRGEFRVECMTELEKIRKAHRKWSSFDELNVVFPNFKIIEIVTGPPFKDEDRESLMAPSQWETHTATYCNGLLKR